MSFIKKPYPTGEFAVKRTRLEESTCPVARSLDIIGDWWSLLIIRDAALRGRSRYSGGLSHR
jgi:hypothetical protein